MKKHKVKLIVLAIFALIIGVFLLGFQWTVNRISVPEGSSLLLRYKGSLVFGSDHAPVGSWASEGQVGILEKLRGPGRHFYCPIWWERTIVPDILIKPGEVGVVTCKLGEPLPAAEFLVDGEIGDTKHQGILRKVLSPGRYRINPYGYEVKVIQAKEDTVGNSIKHSGWVSIPTGYVGVVTNRTDNPLLKQKAGIQDNVLPPGLYPINPNEQQIDIVEIGYRETSVNIDVAGTVEDLTKIDEAGQAPDATLKGGISFPSSDGFKITMDFTAIWGLMPNQAPNAIRKFGNVDSVESKIVLPQIESICRNNGSEYRAVQLLVGKEREKFQNDTLKEFKHILKDKEIELQYGLVRHIYIPKEVRTPIQLSFISDELRLTREQEQLTTKAESELREAERKVVLEQKRVEADTKKLVAEKAADGEKLVAETEAETRKLVAAVERETAELQSEAKLVMGKADSDGKKGIEEAKAGRFKLAVAAFGTPRAYNNWTFATGLPDNIDLKLFYAGQGTLWTDLEGAIRLNVPIDPNAPKVPPKKIEKK